jgi:hypothetical protein
VLVLASDLSLSITAIALMTKPDGFLSDDGQSGSKLLLTGVYTRKPLFQPAKSHVQFKPQGAAELLRKLKILLDWLTVGNIIGEADNNGRILRPRLHR